MNESFNLNIDTNNIWENIDIKKIKQIMKIKIIP